QADGADTPRVTRLDVTPREAVVIAPAHRLALAVPAALSGGTNRDVTRLALFQPPGALLALPPRSAEQRPQKGEVTVLVRYLNQRVPVQMAFVPARPEFVWRPPPAINFIDQLVFTKLRALRIQPSPPCPDHVFVRRAYLDALGILPTVAEAREFLEDSRADKQAHLIDRLLERPEFADFWALKWSDVLRNEEKVLDRKGVAVFHRWIRQ